jgi:hypothetical protein
MGAKIILGFLVLLGLFIGGQQWRSNQQKKEMAKRGRVALAIEDAQSRNQTKVTLTAPIVFHASFKGLDDALAKYTTLIAQPIAQYTHVSSNTKEIETWYKLKVIEFLSEPKNNPCMECSQSGVMPTEMQPTQPDEIVMARNTGTINSEGVTVTTLDPTFPDFDMDQKYLFFVSLDPHTRVASLPLGASAALIVRGDDRIESISQRHSQLSAELVGRYGSLSQIKNALRFRRFPE